ncbi:hypothetical protein ACFOLL_04005 [Falsochrobactrum ovis]
MSATASVASSCNNRSIFLSSLSIDLIPNFRNHFPKFQEV